jgi:SAM-dependent methyltransferase
MEPVEYEVMEQVERTYWWHIGRLEILRRELARRVPNDARPVEILNVGCGTGGTIRMLEEFGRVRNVDVSDHAIVFMRQQGFGNVDKVEGHVLPYADGRFDVVAAFDVLEHIEDDRAALAEWARVVRPGGLVLITVPAYQWLWSSHDVAMHHHRRYARADIRRLADVVGLERARVSYAIVFSLALVVGFRMIERLRGAGPQKASYVGVPDRVNRLFTRLLRVEARLHGVVSFPAGSSVIATLHRPQSGSIERQADATPSDTGRTPIADIAMRGALTVPAPRKPESGRRDQPEATRITG